MLVHLLQTRCWTQGVLGSAGQEGWMGRMDALLGAWGASGLRRRKGLQAVAGCGRAPAATQRSSKLANSNSLQSDGVPDMCACQPGACEL